MTTIKYVKKIHWRGCGTTFYIWITPTAPEATKVWKRVHSQTAKPVSCKSSQTRYHVTLYVCKTQISPKLLCVWISQTGCVWNNDKKVTLIGIFGQKTPSVMFCHLKDHFSLLGKDGSSAPHSWSWWSAILYEAIKNLVMQNNSMPCFVFCFYISVSILEQHKHYTCSSWLSCHNTLIGYGPWSFGQWDFPLREARWCSG